MKYAPRKVYIKENGGYTELSYEDFCRRRETDGTYKDKLFIPVQGCLIETEQTHYIEFYRDKERWRYLKKLDADNSLLSLEAIESADDSNNGFEFIADEAVNVAETVVRRMMLDKLRFAISLLSEDEQSLVNAIFFRGLSEREWSKASGIPQKTINDRKRKILSKLKKLLEK
ncbi:sigma-70 family RNA polymerase sigma factor [Lachnospiraceae bacterium 29-91]